MYRFGVFHCLRIFMTNRFRFISSFILLLFLLVFFLRFHRSLPTNSLRKSRNLLNQQKILVPVSIKDLYDYQVVCSDTNRDDSIRQLTDNCQINFQGHLNVTLHPPDDFQIDSLSTNKYLQQWQTIDSSCSLHSNETIAIVIPYRDRRKNLRNLLFSLIPLLQRQKISRYQIFIVEQETTGAFNKGRLLNIAFKYLRNTYRSTCVIFHGKFSLRISQSNRSFL